MADSIADVNPGRAYGSDVIARLLDVTEETVQRWARVGKLAHLPRPGNAGPYRFAGSEILKLFGPFVPAAEPETRAERSKRANAALAEVLGKKGG